jgi:dTDP-4-dehydrorhamnose reductase
MNGPVVILGARGLLGQALARECAVRRLEWVPVSRATGVDLAKAQDLAPVLDHHGPALVINAAAMTNLADNERHADRAYALHAGVPAKLAAWSARSGVPWVQVSTDHYFTGPRNVLHGEDAPVTLLNTYARSKHAGEQAALTSPLALVLRTNIVGFRGWADEPTFAEWALHVLRGTQAFTLYDDVWASSLTARQFAAALLDLHAQGARGLWNLAAREAASKAEFVLALARACGLSAAHARVENRPAHSLPPRANAMGLDVRRAEALLQRRLPGTQEVVAALRDEWLARRRAEPHPEKSPRESASHAA